MTIEDRDVLSLTADAIAGWVEDHDDMLRGLVALRVLGVHAEQAIQAVLSIPEVQVLRISFELFSLLAEDSGVDSRILLRRASSGAHVRSLDAAVFGEALLSDGSGQR